MHTSPGWLFGLFTWRSVVCLMQILVLVPAATAWRAPEWLCPQTDRPPGSVLAFVYSPVSHSPLPSLHLPLNNTAKTSEKKKEMGDMFLCMPEGQIGAA